MINIWKEIIGSVASHIPIRTLNHLSNTRLVIPYYHLVSDEDVIHVKHLYKYKNIKLFTEDVEYYSRNYNLLTLKDLIKHSYSDIELPDKSMLLTFDDGFSEMYHIVFRILRQKGIPAVFFLNTNFIDNKDMCYLNKASILIDVLQKHRDRYIYNNIECLLRVRNVDANNIKEHILNIKYSERERIDIIGNDLRIDFGDYLKNKKPYLKGDEIQEMVLNGFEIGSHGLDHPVFSEIPIEEQIRQVSECNKILKERFLIEIGAFSFPHHDNGVSKKFFDEITSNGNIHLTFGTHGEMDDSIRYNYQRINAERSLLPAKNIIARKLIKKWYLNTIGSGYIDRTKIIENSRTS